MLDKECTVCEGNGTIKNGKVWHDDSGLCSYSKCPACGGTGLKPWARGKKDKAPTYKDTLN